MAEMLVYEANDSVLSELGIVSLFCDNHTYFMPFKAIMDMHILPSSFLKKASQNGQEFVTF